MTEGQELGGLRMIKSVSGDKLLEDKKSDISIDSLC